MEIYKKDWVVLISDSTDPYFNIATEMFIIQNKPFGENKNVFMLWQNYNSIIVGKHQCIDENINVLLAKKDNVKIVRRKTGGGAVYQDKGNLIFSFLVNKKHLPVENFNSYEYFLDPIIKSLKLLGLNVKFQGKNDLMIESKKISGNAQSIYKNAFLLAQL